MCFFIWRLQISSNRGLDICHHCYTYGIPINTSRDTLVLLDIALTHKSFMSDVLSESKCSLKHIKKIPFAFFNRLSIFKKDIIQEVIPNNERLEFLGDAVLGLVTTQWLMQRFLDKSEGVLTRMKSYMISKNSLYNIAKKLHLEDILLMKDGVLSESYMYKCFVKENRVNTQQLEDTKIFAPLANAVEAIIGALYLSMGIKTSQKFIYTHFNSITTTVMAGLHQKDYKSLVQHYAQSSYNVKPVYGVVGEKGMDHNKIYTVKLSISVNKKIIICTQGSGNTKKAAEQSAASGVCKKLAIEDKDILF